MMTNRLPAMAMLFMLSVGSPVRAQEHNEQKHRHEEQHTPHAMVAEGGQEAHVHGIAELLVVLEGEQLDLELRSPASNLVGFEHRASNPEQQARVLNTQDALLNANNLFRFGSAQCQLTDLDVDVSHMLEENGHQQTEPYNEDHPDAKHDTSHHDRQKAHDHSNIEARYHYRCNRPDQLDSLRTSISVVFPGVESLLVQWIISGRQGAATLDNTQHHLNFR